MAQEVTEEEGDGEEEDGCCSDASSDLSSVPSMGRQMTELTDVHCREIMDRQCSSFTNRPSEFWVRQNTVPALRQNIDCMDSLRRQISCPEPQPAMRGFAPLEGIDDTTPAATPMGSRQVSIQNEEAVDVGLLETAICTVVSECNFSITVADPWSLDADMIAVSEGFIRMTGYQREEVIGENCRFLSEGCPLNPEERARLKESAETGTPYVGVLVNRKRTGEPFLNLLDLRGLVIARNRQAEDEIWINLAMQMDVTGIAIDELPKNHFASLNQVAARIRKRLLKNLSELGLGGILGKFKLQTRKKGGFASRGPTAGAATTDDALDGAKGDEEGSWYLLTDTCWRTGDKAGPAVSLAAVRELPSLETLAADLPPLVGLSRRLDREDTAGAAATAAPTAPPIAIAGPPPCAKTVAPPAAPAAPAATAAPQTPSQAKADPVEDKSLGAVSGGMSAASAVPASSSTSSAAHGTPTAAPAPPGQSPAKVTWAPEDSIAAAKLPPGASREGGSTTGGGNGVPPFPSVSSDKDSASSGSRVPLGLAVSILVAVGALGAVAALRAVQAGRQGGGGGR